MKWKNSSWQDGRVFSNLSPAERTEEKGKLGQNNEYFVECCGCDYRNGKTKGVNMGLGVENSVKSGRESDLSGLRK